MENLLDASAGSISQEIARDILTYKNIRIEKIVSMGQVSDDWYDQQEAEWVCVLTGNAELTYEDGSIHSLKAGEHIFIPPHTRHKVTYTSSPCLWLCVFADE